MREKLNKSFLNQSSFNNELGNLKGFFGKLNQELFQRGPNDRGFQQQLLQILFDQNTSLFSKLFLN